MTAPTKPPEQRVDDPSLDRARSRIRFLTITVVVLAIALIGLGAWLVSERATSSETAVTEEIQSVVDDYLAAWNTYDGDTFLELVTSDYALDMTSGPVSMILEAKEASELINGLAVRDWQETSIGQPSMTGEGPWFVSVVEHFTAPDYGPEGADGVSTFTIVDEGGTLKVARHTYVGNN